MALVAGAEGAPLVFVAMACLRPNAVGRFQGVDLKGKVAVVLVNDPDFEDTACAQGCPSAARMTYYGRWTYKYEEAARRARRRRAGGA
jgi:hypothetical protein